MEGLTSYGVYNQNKNKPVSERAIAVLIEMYVIINRIHFNIWNKIKTKNTNEIITTSNYKALKSYFNGILQ